MTSNILIEMNRKLYEKPCMHVYKVTNLITDIQRNIAPNDFDEHPFISFSDLKLWHSKYLNSMNDLISSLLQFAINYVTDF